MATAAILLLCSAACASAAAGGVVTDVPSAMTGPMPPTSLPSPDTVAWTAAPGVVITSGATGLETPLDLFTRLDVLGRDSLGLRVDCRVCVPTVEGYVFEDALVTEVLPPEVAAWGTLPEFLLAVRSAAANRDLDYLRPVMVADFTYAFIGIQTPEEAFAFWNAEDYWSLDELAGLLDRGVRTTDGRLWSAPPQFVSDSSYRGARAGFRRRPDGRWEWVYLIRDIVDRR
jgi:hypothetical protein